MGGYLIHSALYLPGNLIETGICDPTRIASIIPRFNYATGRRTGTECANGIVIVIAPWPENSFEASTVLVGRMRIPFVPRNTVNFHGGWLSPTILNTHYSAAHKYSDGLGIRAGKRSRRASARPIYRWYLPRISRTWDYKRIPWYTVRELV